MTDAIELVGWALILALAADRLIAFAVTKFGLGGTQAAILEYAGALVVGIAAAALSGELLPVTLDNLLAKLAIVYAFTRAVYLLFKSTNGESATKRSR